MVGGFVDAKGLPEQPLDAAAEFYERIVPSLRNSTTASSDLIIVFDPADHTHDKWRQAAIQDLAREAAPCRINAVVGSRENLQGTAQTIQYLHDAPGITGQILTVDAISDERH